LKRSTDSSPNLHLNITENTMRFGSHLKKKNIVLKLIIVELAGIIHSHSVIHVYVSYVYYIHINVQKLLPRNSTSRKT